MRRIKGLRDIKTHSTFAREGQLVNVARDLHRIERSGSSENESWDGSVNRTVFKRGAKAPRPTRNLFQDLASEREIRATQVRQIQELVVEMEMFADEGISGALTELQRLEEKLSQVRDVKEQYRPHG